MNFRRYRVAILVLIAALACGASATYADTFQLTFTSGMTGVLNLTATAKGGGSFLVTGVSGNENGLNVGSIVPANASGYFPMTNGTGFAYDNMLFPGASPIFDNAGLLFTLVGSGGSIYENLYSIGPTFYLQSAFLSNGAPFPWNYNYVPVTFSLSKVSPTVAAPEPSTGVLFAIGLAALAIVVFVRKLF